MNTEHTNQSSQTEPVPHSPIDLQSIPDRQRSFTAENIRDIARACIRIGDNDQAAVVFAIADALRDGSLVIQPPAQQQAEPVNQQQAGVYHKFNVSRTDGRDLPGGDRHGAEYFVLDVTHDEFAMPALAAYAAACRSDYPALADDMVHRYGIAQQQAAPVAWGCFHFGGKRDGKLYSFSDTKEQADAYIANIHQSRDDITLRCGPIYDHRLTDAAQPPAVAVAAPDVVEQIAQQWDGCMYDSADGCHIDIGQDIRQAGQRLAGAPQATAEEYSVVQEDTSAPATEYSWSSNGEEYHGRFSSVAEAVCDYLDSEGGDAEETVHVGEVKPYEPGQPIWLADNVLETLSDNAYGEIGEWVEDWPELPPEKREQLGKMIQDFVWKHDAPRFFSIGKSELVDVAPYRDDAAAQKGGA